MVKKRTVVNIGELTFGPVTDWELDVGIEYAKEKCKLDLSKELLRIIVNTVQQRRKPETKLPFLAGNVVRLTIPPKDKVEMPKYEGYKSATMKIFSDRSARKRAADAEKRKRGQHVPPAVKQTEHPEDPKRKGQFMLL